MSTLGKNTTGLLDQLPANEDWVLKMKWKMEKRRIKIVIKAEYKAVRVDKGVIRIKRTYIHDSL